MFGVQRRNRIEGSSSHAANDISKGSVSTEGSSSPRQEETRHPYRNKEKL